MKVLKFGSSALSTPDNVSRVKTIIEKYDGPVVVVTAAIDGAPNAIESAKENAKTVQA